MTNRWSDKSGFQYEAAIEGNTNTWLTPPELVSVLGLFDLDPCAAGADYLSACHNVKPKGREIPTKDSVCSKCGKPTKFRIVTFKRPWDLAKENWTLADGNSLTKPWPSKKRAFVNFPYGVESQAWLEKCSTHGNCIALSFARIETKAFFTAWDTASAFLFLPGRLSFYLPDGTLSKGKPAANVLIAWGDKNRNALLRSGLAGAFIDHCVSVLPGIRVN